MNVLLWYYVLRCVNNEEPIPEGTKPMYTTAMRNAGTCASGLSSEKEIYPLIVVSRRNDRESI